MRRYPTPWACATSAAPITSTASRRRNKHPSGSNTCVPPQPSQRPRRGRTPCSPPDRRTRRALAHPQRPQTSPAPRALDPTGHQLHIDARRVAPYDQHQMPPGINPKDPLVLRPETARGSLRGQTPSRCRHTNDSATTTTADPVLTIDVARHPPDDQRACRSTAVPSASHTTRTPRHLLRARDDDGAIGFGKSLVPTSAP
jgi:hypothetical protein